MLFKSWLASGRTAVAQLKNTQIFLPFILLFSDITVGLYLSYYDYVRCTPNYTVIALKLNWKSQYRHKAKYEV